jgi:hypothetical protein
MTWEETNKDMGAYQQALDAQAASGVDRRVAEGRARRAAVRAYRSAHPDEDAAHAAAARTAAPVGAAAPAAAAAGDGAGAAAAAPAGGGTAVAVAAAAPLTAAVREAPLSSVSRATGSTRGPTCCSKSSSRW